MDTLEPKTLIIGSDTQTLAMPPEPGLGLGLGLEDSPFKVGDFVWGKFKDNQWWPGRIREPSESKDSDPDQNSKLVVCFGMSNSYWCNPSQLKPFASNIDKFASSSNSKSFQAAVDLAVSEFSKCSEAHLSSHSARKEEGLDFGPNGCNFSIRGFLDLVKDAALDVQAVDVLEIGMLKNGVVAYEKGLSVGHCRKTLFELAYQIEHDAFENADAPEENSLTNCSRGKMKNKKNVVSRKARAILDLEVENDSVGGVGKEEEVGSGRRKRKKSKYLLPPYTHLSGEFAKSLSSKVVKCNTLGLDKGEEEEISRASVLIDGFDVGEMVSELEAMAVNPLHLKGNHLGKIVRGFFSEYRRSVFCMSGKVYGENKTVGKCNTLGLDEEEEEETRRALVLIDGLDVVELVSELEAMAVNPLHLKGNHLGKIVRGFFSEYRRSVFRMSGEVYGENKTVVKCNTLGLDKEEEEETRRALVLIDGLDVVELLSELEAMAVNPLHLKGNHLGKVVRGFFAEYRRSVFCMSGKVYGENKTVDKEVGDTWEEGGRKRKDVVDIEGEVLNVESEEGQETEVRRERKKKVVVNGEVSTPGDKSELCKKTDQGGEKIPIDKSEEVMIAEGEGEASNDMAEVGTTTEVKRRKVTDKSDEGKKAVVKRGRKRKVGLNGETMKLNNEAASKGNALNNDGSSGSMRGKKITNDSGERKPRQRKKNKGKTNPEDPAALLLTFSPGNTVPSKEELISACSKYGLIIESETELLKESKRAKVVFVRSSDAEKAFNDQVAAIGPHVAGYRLRYLTGSLTPIPVPKPPLPYIRKSLEQMISSIGGVELKTATSASLVGEMQGLLMKVDKLLTGPAPAGTSA